MKYIKTTGHEAIPFLGKYAMDKEVIQELTYPITTSKDHVWYIALNEFEEAVGFCSAIPRKNHVSFCHAYVHPEWRKNGIYTKLFDMRIQDFKDQRIKAVCTPKSVEAFKASKFNITKETKKYSFVEKN